MAVCSSTNSVIPSLSGRPYWPTSTPNTAVTVTRRSNATSYGSQTCTKRSNLRLVNVLNVHKLVKTFPLYYLNLMAPRTPVHDVFDELDLVFWGSIPINSPSQRYDLPAFDRYARFTLCLCSLAHFLLSNSVPSRFLPTLWPLSELLLSPTSIFCAPSITFEKISAPWRTTVTSVRFQALYQERHRKKGHWRTPPTHTAALRIRFFGRRPRSPNGYGQKHGKHARQNRPSRVQTHSIFPPATMSLLALLPW